MTCDLHSLRAVVLVLPSFYHGKMATIVRPCIVSGLTEHELWSKIRLASHAHKPLPPPPSNADRGSPLILSAITGAFAFCIVIMFMKVVVGHHCRRCHHLNLHQSHYSHRDTCAVQLQGPGTVILTNLVLRCSAGVHVDNLSKKNLNPSSFHSPHARLGTIT